MAGTVYGVGVGPGDPELMTIKAARILREVDVIAVPGTVLTESIAYRIAVSSVPEMARKELIAMPSPMVHDRKQVEAAQRTNACALERYLDEGKDIACITLGDPTIYSTFSYVQRVLIEDGYDTEVVSGVPSFCAAAARLDMPLVEWDEPLHVIPAVHAKGGMVQEGTYVLMKAGRHLGSACETLASSGREIWLVENCGRADERVFEGAGQIPHDADYLSLVIAK